MGSNTVGMNVHIRHVDIPNTTHYQAKPSTTVPSWNGQWTNAINAATETLPGRVVTTLLGALPPVRAAKLAVTGVTLAFNALQNRPTALGGTNGKPAERIFIEATPSLYPKGSVLLPERLFTPTVPQAGILGSKPFGVNSPTLPGYGVLDEFTSRDLVLHSNQGPDPTVLGQKISERYSKIERLKDGSRNQASDRLKEAKRLHEETLKDWGSIPIEIDRKLKIPSQLGHIKHITKQLHALDDLISHLEQQTSPNKNN